ncbi:MAG: bifunctional (p)ppGpp synthetase/guanosine-3',5'-bis(diphosphate) 3'-pyrophosphohydrolase [Magnetococcales bacterium]|nr:bifunctional (p)ppGpp synthetase/guanosine-3',5'-bis(diphosphate) 3'-pyrophosphohydrolase [Magnetococcales bacterium]
MKGWNRLISRILDYNPQADQSLLNQTRGFVVALSKRKEREGPAFTMNPASVAGILADLRLDVASIAAGMLVEGVNSGATTLEEINDKFGSEIGFLVEGVTRISLISARAKTEIQAEDFRKMILAMAKDIRVVLVRLALCLEQVRTAAANPTPIARRIAREILEIHAPIAHRLGIYWIKSDLEEYAFQLSQPELHDELKQRVDASRKGGADVVRKVVSIMRKLLRKHRIAAEVFGREKHLYSVWTKLSRKNTTFDELHDLIGYRIIVRKKSDCYRALGMIHGEFHPVPGRFKDYVAMPKSNGYQSLHTVVIGPFGNRIEVQIRTEKMHQVAESGVAAHWNYKGKGIQTKKRSGATGYAWLKQLLEVHQNADNPSQFLENVKIDLFPGEIYLFTPGGDILALPKGATPVDFAYAVHSQVGDRCQGCKVNGRMVPLKTKLNTGDSVEIITSKEPRPNLSWLEFVVSGRAKYRITRWGKEQRRQESILLGREMLEREIRKVGHGLALREKYLKKGAQELGLDDCDELLYQVGTQTVTPLHTLHRMFPETFRKAERSQKTSSPKPRSTSAERRADKAPKGELKLSGLLPEIAVQAARCCSPIPGDAIVGIISTGKGVTIHRSDCPNLDSFRNQPERRIEDVDWPDMAKDNHLARLRAMVRKPKKVLAQVSHAVMEAKASVIKVQFQDRDRDPCVLILDVEVGDLNELGSVLEKLRALSEVMSVERIRG